MNSRSTPGLLERRLELVGEIARLTGDHQQAMIAACGAEIELQRSRQACDGPEVTGADRRDLERAITNEAESKAALRVIEERIGELERAVAELDGRLAGT